MLALSCGAGSALAQAAAQRDGALPEVKVTAEGETASGPANGVVAKRSATGTKTDTPLIETPQSITVVTREQMEAQAADSLDQAFAYSAGIVPLTGGAQRRTGTAFVVRGFNVTGSAPLYLNGSKFPINSLSGSVDNYLFERVELLKGPASVLYGQAAPGGIINLVSKRPTATPLREVEVQLGSWSKKQAMFDLGGPIGDDGRLGYRLTGLFRDSKTMIEPIPDDRTSLAATLDWRLTDRTLITLLASYNKSGGIYDYGKPFEGTLLPNPGGRIASDLFVGEPGFDNFDTKGSTLGYLLEHRLGESWTFRQNLLAFDYEADNAWASISQRADAATNFRTATRQSLARFDTDKGWSLDNQLVGKLRHGGFEHTVLAGVDYSDRDFARNQRSGNAPRPLDLFNPVYGSPIALGAATRSVSAAKQTGLYVQDHIKLDKRWVALLGGRYDKARNTSASIAATGAVTPGTPADQHKFTPRAGLMYLFDNGLAPYYSYTRSFQPQSGFDFFRNPFVPTQGKQHELGIKYEPPGTHASVSAAAFELVQQNIVVGDLAHPGFSTQIGEQRSRGIEIEGRASLLNRRLDLVGSATAINARITKTTVAAQLGTPPTSVPRNSFALWADYRFEALPGLSAALGVRRTGVQEVSRLQVPSFTVLDAALRYQTGPWRLALNVKNLTDKTYLGACTFACFYGDEREVTLSARYSW